MNFDLSSFFKGGAFGLTVLVLGLVVAHLIPWHRFIGRKLPRLWAYVIGSAIIWSGFFIWRFTGHDDIETPLALAVAYIFGGGIVIAMYWIDGLGVTLDVNRRLNRGDDAGIHSKR